MIVPLGTNHEGGDDLYSDNQGRPVNIKGYLIDQETGDVIHNTKGNVMFKAELIDSKGQLPAPFNIEKFGFNPFEL